MTTVADPAARERPATARPQRLAVLARQELRLLTRFRMLVAVVGVTALWAVLLRVLDAPTRSTVTPFVLFFDVTALGLLFVPALLVGERAERVDQALRVTPVRAWERVTARVGATMALSVGSGAVVVAAGGSPGPLTALLAVAILSALFALLAVALLGGADDLTTFLLRSPLVLGPLLAPAIVAVTGLVDTPWLHLTPVTGAMTMLQGAMRWPVIVWQAVWLAGAAAMAVRALDRPVATTASGTTRHAHRQRPHPGDWSTRRAIASMAWVDRRTVARDALVLLLIGSVPLVAVVARLAGTVGVAFVADRTGVDLSAHVPVLWVVLLVLHTPVMVGSVTGLLLLEDRDHGVLPAVAVTRASVWTLLSYRLATAVVVSAVLVAVSLPIAGVDHPAGPIGAAALVMAAAVCSPVPALLMAGTADNRAQGVAALKMLSLPLYLPIASWFVDPTWWWPFAPVPTAWATWATWTSSPAAAVAYAGIALTLSAALTVPLARRLVARAG